MTTANRQPFNILVTRPEPKASELVELLQQHQISAFSYPLFNYQLPKDISGCEHLLTSKGNNVIVFVSVSAVKFANEIVAASKWYYQTVIAVGDATKKALTALGITVISPTLQNSEGMLAMTELQQVADKNIAIIRGEDGRELLFETLTERGANVEYGQSYQRIWQLPSKQLINQWQQQGINCLVITSVALLENMLNLLLSVDNYWQKHCYWLVASERIAKKAKQLGIEHIYNLESADNNRVMQKIIEME